MVIACPNFQFRPMKMIVSLLGLSTVTVFIRFTAAVIRYPVPYHQWSWGIVLMAVNYMAIYSSEIFPLSCVILGCSMHFAMLAAHVTLFPVARPRIQYIPSRYHHHYLTHFGCFLAAMRLVGSLDVSWPTLLQGLCLARYEEGKQCGCGSGAGRSF